MRVVLSPCIKICKMDPVTLRCVGCHRTTKQITEWIQYPDVKRQQIINQLNEYADTIKPTTATDNTQG